MSKLDHSIINKQGYGLDRKGTWKRGICEGSYNQTVFKGSNFG